MLQLTGTYYKGKVHLEKIICDTDVMIDYWVDRNARHKETKPLLENDISLDNVVLTAITKLELLAGAINKKEIGKIDRKKQKVAIGTLAIATQQNDIIVKKC